MSYVEWPSGLVPEQVEFGLRANTQVSVSELSGDVQTLELPGARWSLSLTMPPLTRNPDSAAMEAFIASLRGQAVRARMPLFKRTAPLGTWAGSPTVDNEVGSPTLSQTGTTLWTRNFSPFATVKKGDYFNLGSGGQLLMVTADATADSNGTAQLAVQPAIRSAPAHGLGLVSANPVVPLMILTDPHPRWRMKIADITEHALDFVEVFG